MTTAKANQAQPFLFLGAGFGTSRKCLECQLVFERPPSPEERARIETLLPPALGHVKRWQGAVLAFGSDDALEMHVSRSGRKPTKADWTAFCEDVERRVLGIHGVVPIAIFVKPDDGEYGHKLGPWHHWSVHELQTRFQQLGIASTRGEGAELAPVCLGVLRALEAGGMAPLAQRALVDWAATIAAASDGRAGQMIVDGILALLPEGRSEDRANQQLDPTLVERLFRHPTRRLVGRLGKDSLVKRALVLLASATPGTADEALGDLLNWMLLDAQAAIQIGEALLAAGAMKDAVATRSAVVREGLVRGKPTGKTSPCIVLVAHAHHLLETRSPGLALECLDLALRFPDPLAKVHGMRVRALHGAGQASHAQALAASALVQEQAGAEDPTVYYEVARYHLELGRLPEAIAQLRLYVEREPQRAGMMLRFDPRLAPLRALPEFEALFETMKAPGTRPST
jgi:hypothetical protein